MRSELYQQIHDIEGDHWWYVGRRRIIFDLLDRMGGDPPTRVLDIGCGTGQNLLELRNRGFDRVVGLDISPAAIEYARVRGQQRLVRADGMQLPFADRAFDLVLALDLLEHLRDDRRALIEVARVLAPGGRLIVFTPAFRFLWGLQDEASHHFRRYTSGELRAKLNDAGFRIARLTYANTLLFPLVLAGRTVGRMIDGGRRISENDLHPVWANGVLAAIFRAEAPLLRRINFPFGVSLLSVAIRA